MLAYRVRESPYLYRLFVSTNNMLAPEILDFRVFLTFLKNESVYNSFTPSHSGSIISPVSLSNFFLSLALMYLVDRSHSSDFKYLSIT